MSNPNLPLGTLNRLLASVSFTEFPSLNITASYLGKAGIKFKPTTPSSLQIPAMVGLVTSLEPYQTVEITIPMLKTTGLASAYKNQIETNCLLGDISVTPDAVTLSTYSFDECSITAWEGLDLSGTNAEFVITLTARYQINSINWG